MSFDLNGQPTSGTTRWQIASNMVKTATAAHDSRIRFGLSFFPQSMTTCDANPPVVGINSNAAQRIAAHIPALSGQTSGPDAASTPIAAALTAAANEPELSNPAYANHVMLVTDGDEQCGGNPVDAVKNLFRKGIKTYVVGFAGAAYVNPQTLNAMAIEGGTARPGAEAYYRAEDQPSLLDALGKIYKSAANCSFDLRSEPPDPNKLFVYVNGNLVTQDTTRTNGWDYLNNLRIPLFGAACDALAQGSNGNVTLVYGCPDAVIGGGTTCSDETGDGGVTLN